MNWLDIEDIEKSIHAAEALPENERIAFLGGLALTTFQSLLDEIKAHRQLRTFWSIRPII